MLVDSALYAASNASINCLLATVYNVFKLFNILSGGILGRTKHGSVNNPSQRPVGATLRRHPPTRVEMLSD